MGYSVNRTLLDGVLLSYDFIELEDGNFIIRNAKLKIGEDEITSRDGLSYKYNKGRLEFILFDILPIYSIQTIDGEIRTTINKDLTDVDFRNITKIHKSIDKGASLKNLRIINSQRKEKWPILRKEYRYNGKGRSDLMKADLHTHFSEILTHEEFEDVINKLLGMLGIKNFMVDKKNYSIPIQNGQITFADFENILNYRGNVLTAIKDETFLLKTYMMKIDTLLNLLEKGRKDKVVKVNNLLNELSQLYEDFNNQIEVLHQNNIILDTEYDILKKFIKKWEDANLTPDYLKEKTLNREFTFTDLKKKVRTIKDSYKDINEGDSRLVLVIKQRIRDTIYYELLTKSIDSTIKDEVDYIEISFSNTDVISNLTKKMSDEERKRVSFLYSVSRKKMSTEKESVFKEEKFEELLRDRKIVGFDLMGEERGLTVKDITDYNNPNSFCSVIYKAIDKMISCKKSDPDRDCVLRIHAGENEESNYNPLYSLAVIEKILNERFKNDKEFWPKIRIGHGVYFPKNNELQKEYARLLRDLDAVVEINASSNYSLSNVKRLSTIPYEWYLKNRINMVYGTDGPGMYYTSLRQQRILARELRKKIGISIENIPNNNIPKEIELPINLPSAYKEMMQKISTSLAEFSKTEKESKPNESEEDLQNELELLFREYKMLQEVLTILKKEELISVKDINIDAPFKNLLSGKKVEKYDKNELEQFIEKVEMLLSKEQEIISDAQQIPLYYYKEYIPIISQGDDEIESAQDEKFDLIDGKKMDRRGRIKYSLGELHRYFRDELSNGFEFENIDLFSDTLKDVESCLEKGDLDTAEMKIVALEIKNNLVISFLPAFKKIVVENESLDDILSGEYNYELSKLRKAVIRTSLNDFDNDKLILSEKDNMVLLSNYKYYNKYLDMCLEDDNKIDNEFKELTYNKNNTMLDRDERIKNSLDNLRNELPSSFDFIIDSIDSSRDKKDYDTIEMQITALEIVNGLEVSILPAFKKIVNEDISIREILSKDYNYGSFKKTKGGSR